MIQLNFSAVSAYSAVNSCAPLLRSPDDPIIDSNVHPSQTFGRRFCKTLGVTSQTLASTLEGFLGGSRSAIVMEDGAVVFDLERAKYSVSGEHNKCLLHFWSEERNAVRRVLDVETKGETLRLMVQKFGQGRPTRLDIHRERDPRSASAKRMARASYQRVLTRCSRSTLPIGR